MMQRWFILLMVLMTLGLLSGTALANPHGSIVPFGIARR